MTGFIPDPAIVSTINAVVEGTIGSAKTGSVAVSESDDFYSEEDAAEQSNFNIQAWIESKGNNGSADTNSNLLLSSLEDQYSVPMEKDISETGQAVIEFSSKIMPLNYDELVAKYIFLFTSSGYRRLEEEPTSEVSRQLIAGNSTYDHTDI